MSVRSAPLPSSRHELGSNTITAALHISDGFDDYQPNVITDPHVGKMGNVHEVNQKRLCVLASVIVTLCAYVCVIACVSKGFQRSIKYKQLN